MVLDLEGKGGNSWWSFCQGCSAASNENQELEEEAMEAMLALGYKAAELKKIKKFWKERRIQQKLYQVCHKMLVK